VESEHRSYWVLPRPQPGCSDGTEPDRLRISVGDLVTDPTGPVAACRSIAEAAEATGTSVDTLRYYERAGVLPDIARSPSGQRLYSDDDLGWIAFVRRLRATGMSMRRIEEYATMVRAGEGTVADRRALLEAHRATVAAAIDELVEALGVLDAKIDHYAAAERGVDVGCSEVPLRHVPELG
jgi:DNA-binding transcriptional MerR regulator